MESPESVMYQGAVMKYATVGSVAVLAWDIIDNIPGDYRLLFGKYSQSKKPTFAKCVYIIARLAALSSKLVEVIGSTAPVKHCVLVNALSFGLCPLSIGGTGLLFFFRLRAIYNRNRVVVAVFSILWLGLLASAILLPLGFRGSPIGNTSYCMYHSVSKISFYSRIGPWVFDTLVFIAISWRLSHIGASSKGTARRVDSKHAINTLLFGTDLPNFTRSLLIDGQIYYLITVIFGIASTILTFGPLVKDPLSNMLQDPYLVLVNIMACRVFRRTMSGAIRESEISTSALGESFVTPMQFRPPESNSSRETISKNVLPIPKIL